MIGSQILHCDRLACETHLRVEHLSELVDLVLYHGLFEILLLGVILFVKLLASIDD